MQPIVMNFDAKNDGKRDRVLLKQLDLNEIILVYN